VVAFDIEIQAQIVNKNKMQPEEIVVWCVLVSWLWLVAELGLKRDRVLAKDRQMSNEGLLICFGIYLIGLFSSFAWVINTFVLA
jgi:hypothetical protein